MLDNGAAGCKAAHCWPNIARGERKNRYGIGYDQMTLLGPVRSTDLLCDHARSTGMLAINLIPTVRACWQF